MELSWSLYNKIERLRVENLSTAQVRTILLSIPTRRLDQWYACASDQLRWLPLADHATFFEDVRVFRGAEAAGHLQIARAPAPLKLVGAPPEAPAEWIEGSDFDLSTLALSERRAARRVSRRCEFVVAGGPGEFRSLTKDLSFGGLSIETALPAWVPKTFRATLSTAGKTAEILCTRVSDSNFQIVESDSWPVLHSWLKAAG